MHRLVHKEGSFVITFPNAYHAGFNTGEAHLQPPRPLWSLSFYTLSATHQAKKHAEARMREVVPFNNSFSCPGLRVRMRMTEIGMCCGPGFNCAEAVNFGPPDWLPWGTYVADKYRREGRSATLSHDALLIALVAAAPDVSARLKREAQVRACFRCCTVPPECGMKDTLRSSGAWR